MPPHIIVYLRIGKINTSSLQLETRPEFHSNYFSNTTPTKNIFFDITNSIFFNVQRYRDIRQSRTLTSNYVYFED